MPASYLHGVETIELTKGPVPVRVVKSAVIGLIGIAPKGPSQSLITVNSATDAAQFGEQLPGFTIPQALSAIQKQGAGTILVVNVFDEVAHGSAVTAETQTVASRKAKTAFAPVGATAPVVTNNAASTTYVPGTDYTIDEFGNIKILNAAITDGSVIKITYKKLNGAAVTSSVIIGSINGSTGVKTGTKLFLDSYNMFGFKPKLFISPGYSTVNAVATELIAMADLYKAHALIDAPIGTTPAGAITGRGPSGAINLNTSSKRAFLLYPHMKVSDPDPSAASNATLLAPYSQFMAGIIASTDLNEGYWVSPSNHEIKGILGVERNISAAINDSTTETNQLNEAGITTTFNSFGTGIRTWGNRAASFPSSTHPSNFIPVQRTADILHESVELAMLQFIDKPINQAIIDAIRETVNSFMRTLIARGALIDGKNDQGQTTGCYFDKAKNLPTDIAAGKLTFDLVFMPPTPAEWITFNSFIDISLLKSLS